MSTKRKAGEVDISLTNKGAEKVSRVDSTSTKASAQKLDEPATISTPTTSSEPERRICPFLDTINRKRLDFDLTKQCSVSLVQQNVYVCLVCGGYFQGRGRNTHANSHSFQMGHHVRLFLCYALTFFTLAILVIPTLNLKIIFLGLYQLKKSKILLFTWQLWSSWFFTRWYSAGTWSCISKRKGFIFRSQSYFITRRIRCTLSTRICGTKQFKTHRFY